MNTSCKFQAARCKPNTRPKAKGRIQLQASCCKLQTKYKAESQKQNAAEMYSLAARGLRLEAYSPYKVPIAIGMGVLYQHLSPSPETTPSFRLCRGWPRHSTGWR